MQFPALFIIILFLSSCNTNQEGNDIYFIIKKKHITDNSIVPPPPIPFYYWYNFILVDTSKIFFHQKKPVHFKCGVGPDENKPEFLSLTPDKILEIKKIELSSFLNTIPDSVLMDQRFCVTISSSKDTIRNNAFKTIKDFFHSKNSRICFLMRNWSEEEQYVVTAKIENKEYDYPETDWKIGFNYPLPDSIK